uniref:Uncharacterized protein P0446G09.128 n=2 Tax=Oryza sativa subsp. japonica TaxID=39947 RepID=Q7EYT7_ORYSJ|nr:hypothetical protein [Oryza sativa Japonica Group]BAD31741.1 hypothetical protein [Oryza sativa Japonica Group]
MTGYHLAGSGSPAGGEAGVAAAGGGWREGGGLTAEAAAAPPLRQIWPGAVARHEGRWGQLRRAVAGGKASARRQGTRR